MLSDAGIERGVDGPDAKLLILGEVASAESSLEKLAKMYIRHGVHLLWYTGFQVMTGDAGPSTILDRYPNPFFGGFQASNVVEGTITKVHTDEANNVTFTADVTTLKGEQKHRVPFATPFANAAGTAGIFSIPNVGDKCLVVMAAGNNPYIFAYHSVVQQEPARATASLANSPPGPAMKGTFARSQLIPGCIELRSPGQNRVLLHPGGSILVDADIDLFTFHDAVSSTIESLSRNLEIFTAGGAVLWSEGEETSQTSMEFFANMFTKSATKENTDKGLLRGGAQLQVLFSEEANHFFLEVTDSDNITSRIQIGPNGIILTSGDGTNQGTIGISPTGNFTLIAGDPNGAHTQVDLAEDAIAISAFAGPGSPVASVQATTRGEVTISSDGMVTVKAPQVTIDAQSTITKGGFTNLGGQGGMGVARLMDQISGACSLGGTVIGQISASSVQVTAAG